MRLLSRIAALLITMVTGYSANAQIDVFPNQTATALAQKLVGTGVQISNATLTCPGNANGIFTVVTSNLGLDSGIVLTSGQAATTGLTAGVNGSQTGFFPSQSNGAPGDPQLTTLAQNTTNDACILEFDFIPSGDTIKFDYVFGSEEYDNFSCSGFNDVFGFFISGPGIPTPQNIALIPGTTIAVSVNSTTDPAITQPGSIAQCTAMGPGSPFSQYYIDNSAGATVTYYGFTTVFTAISAVTPCNTYHLKLACADAGDFSLDSGVFLKAGSLTSNGVAVTPIGGGGLSAPVPYAVRGCLPGQFQFSRPLPSADPLTIRYQIAGTAVNGIDYATITDSVVIPPNQTSATQFIYALPTSTPTGPVTVKLYIFSPYTCATPIIVDSAELAIYDSFYVKILTPDTAICKYQTVDILTDGDPLLSYSWTPIDGLNDPNIQNPTATPLQTTTYTVSATLPGSGCTPAHDIITITIKEEPDVDAGPDRVTCLGTPVQLNLTVTPANQTYTYQWTPGTYLNDPTIPNPVSDPAADVTYYIQVDPGAASCFGYDTITVRVLPNDITLFNNDSSICKGASVQINASGDPAFNYRWQPQIWVSDTTIIDPILTPDTSVLYTLTASYPGCPNIVKTLYLDVQPNPIVFIGGDREKCQFDTIQLQPIVTPNTYPFYTYSWTPAGAVEHANVKDAVIRAQADVVPLTLTVKTPAGCTGSDDMNVTVHEGNFGKLAPADTGICPRDTVQMRAEGGIGYDWTPGLYLSDSTDPMTVAYPVTDILYTLIITDEFGCFDTLTSDITVHPDAMLQLGEDVMIFPGESYQMDPQGNGLYFSWFPPAGLSASNIANPLATPEVNTRYFVQAATEWGCTVVDSIDVNVSNESLLEVPNAFTPGSEPNAELKIIKRGIATLKYFRIFNRWGAKVFEASNIDDGWDGTLSGTPQPMGVYVYVVEAYTNTGRRFIKQGNVTLIR